MEYQRLPEEFEVGGFMAQEGLWKIAKKRMLEDGGALPGEDGDPLRECGAFAMHDESFLSSWLREHVEGGKAEAAMERRSEESKSGTRVGGRKERKENLLRAFV